MIFKFPTHKNVVIAGTFDHFHHGHNLLFTIAKLFSSEMLHIGLCSDSMIENKYLSLFIQPFNEREAFLHEYSELFDSEFKSKIRMINDAIDFSGNDPDLDALILTQETRNGYDIINKRRTQNNLKPLYIYCINDEIKPSSINETLNIKKESSSIIRFNHLGKLIKPRNIDNLSKPYLIGVTGCIASGKSCFTKKYAKQFNENHIRTVIFDCDTIAHYSYRKDSKSYEEILNTFGKEVINEQTKEIDRKILGNIVFADNQKLEKLNKIVWNSTIDEVYNKIAIIKRDQSYDLIIIEVPLLFEAGWDSFFNEIWYIYCDNKVIIERLCKERGINENDALKRIQHLKNTKDKVFKSNFVFTTMEEENITLEMIKKHFKENEIFYKSILKN